MRETRPCLWLFVLATLCQCRGEPAPSVAPAATLSAPPANSPAPLAAAPAPTTVASAAPVAPAASVAPSAATSTAAPSPSAAIAGSSTAEPALLAADGTPLPQTEERPSTTSPRFAARMQLLADAILGGDVEKARSTFFPLVAYTQVKDVQKPERDYRYRLMSHFERDLREYHKALGRDAEGARFVGVTVPEARVEWMKPGKEGNRLGYFRVLRSQLRFRLASGKERSFELTSMISWRGEWYVVHLHGFE
jgi:hypothetical protein